VPWIGIDKDQGLLYEGGYRHGHAVWPIPVTAPAAIIAEADFPPNLPPSYALEQADALFREDSFDAVTRVRRGRLYLASQARPEDWQVYPHPYRPTEAHEAMGTRGGTLPRRLFTFQPFHVPNRLQEIEAKGGSPLVVIGTQASYSIWKLTAVEGSSIGEYLLTLRSRQTFGALPELNLAVIPAPHRRAVRDAVTKLRDDIFRAGPSSVVDRARDVASAALSGYLQSLGAIRPGKDLNELIKKLDSLEDPHRKRVAAAAAEIVRLFHSRAKSSVQERLPVSPVREQEAELAAYCAGSILCELGWANWS
jgi:hypothetical protein